MGKIVLTVLILVCSFWAQAANRFYVTGEAHRTISLVEGTVDCEHSEGNQEIISGIAESLQPSADIDAIRKCGLYRLERGLPKVVLMEGYRTKVVCKAFGLSLEIHVSGVFECVR